MLQESIPPNESEYIDGIARISLEILDTKQRPIRRGQHAKHHGCVRAQFVVEPDLPAEMRQGVFREPRTFSAWIRFSNGSRDDDTQGDIRGMAIKLLEVDGEKLLDAERHERTQDFVLMSHPVFFSRDARNNHDLARTLLSTLGPTWMRRLLFWMSAGAARSLEIAIRHFIAGFRFHELRILRAAMSKIPASPLAIQYWSAVPFRLGSAAVKYSARPTQLNDVPHDRQLAPDFLREAMTRHLSIREARFDFLIQTAVHIDTTPIEDATIEWKETDAPFRKVATIIIPQQVFDTPAQMEFCENLSFTPWHSLPEHRPLGGINRARKVTYELISRHRHQLNDTPRAEPH